MDSIPNLKYNQELLSRYAIILTYSVINGTILLQFIEVELLKMRIMKERMNMAWTNFCAKMTGLWLFAAYLFGVLSIAGIFDQLLLKNGKGVFFCIMATLVCASVIYYLYATGAVKRARDVEINDCEGAHL